MPKFDESDRIVAYEYGAMPITFTTVAKDPAKKRVEVHLMPEVKDALVELAKQDNRSLLNYIETLLEKHVRERSKKR